MPTLQQLITLDYLSNTLVDLRMKLCQSEFVRFVGTYPRATKQAFHTCHLSAILGHNSRPRNYHFPQFYRSLRLQSSEALLNPRWLLMQSANGDDAPLSINFDSP